MDLFDIGASANFVDEKCARLVHSSAGGSCADVSGSLGFKASAVLDAHDSDVAWNVLARA